MIRLAGRRDGKPFEEILDWHECTKQDFQQFAQPTPDAERVLSSIMSDPERALICLNWDELADKLVIYGVSSYDDFQFIDMNLVPCQYNHTFNGWRGDTIPEECEWD